MINAFSRDFCAKSIEVDDAMKKLEEIEKAANTVLP